MKKILVTVLATLLLTSCNGWFFRPSPYNPPTPFLPPTQTPSILSPTPVIIGVNSATPMIATATSIPSNTPFPAVTNTPLASDTPVASATQSTVTSAPVLSVAVELLGCSTSLDVTHGMGEVTDSYVILKNTGNLELTNLRATMFGGDEARIHPDKTVELTSLPVNYQVTIKLTTDTTYRAETPIQVEVVADGGLFHRIGSASCLDIGLFAPEPDGLSTPVPINP